MCPCYADRVQGATRSIPNADERARPSHSRQGWQSRWQPLGLGWPGLAPKDGGTSQADKMAACATRPPGLMERNALGHPDGTKRQRPHDPFTWTQGLYAQGVTALNLRHGRYLIPPEGGGQNPEMKSR